MDNNCHDTYIKKVWKTNNDANCPIFPEIKFELSVVVVGLQRYKQCQSLNWWKKEQNNETCDSLQIVQTRIGT